MTTVRDRLGVGSLSVHQSNRIRTTPDAVIGDQFQSGEEIYFGNPVMGLGLQETDSRPCRILQSGAQIHNIGPMSDQTGWYTNRVPEMYTMMGVKDRAVLILNVDGNAQPLELREPFQQRDDILKGFLSHPESAEMLVKAFAKEIHSVHGWNRGQGVQIFLGELPIEVVDVNAGHTTVLSDAESISPTYGVIAEVAQTADQPLPADLREALTDLDEIIEESIESGYKIPTQSACLDAQRILTEMYDISPRRFQVYPMPDGDITIDGSGVYDRWVMLLCKPDGRGLCVVGIDGQERHRHYTTLESLPDEFVRQALFEIDNG